MLIDFIKKNFSLNNFLVILVLIIGAFLRIEFSKIGYNFDMESWDVVRYKVNLNSSVYTGTNRYNYGPIWSYTLYLLNYFFKPVTTQDFHLVLACFMVLVDILIFFLLFKIFNMFVSCIYFLSPISILISGFHVQIDNFSIFFALLFYFFFTKSIEEDSHNIRNFKMYIFSMVLLGVSLSVKHIFIFYPIVIFLIFLRYNFNLFSFRVRILKLLSLSIPYLVFLLFFAFDILLRMKNWEKIVEGIYVNVFSYKSFIGNSFIYQILKFFDDYTELIGANSLNYLISKGSISFIILILISFFIFRKKINFKKSFFYYLLIFYSFSPSLADQYLVIPLIPIIALHFNLYSLLFLISGGLYLAIGSKNNINFYYSIFPNFQIILQKYYFLPQLISFFFFISAVTSKNSEKFKYVSRYLIIVYTVIFNLFLFYLLYTN